MAPDLPRKKDHLPCGGACRRLTITRPTSSPGGEMRERDEWTRRVLGVLRHDLTLVALAVAFVVLSAGVFAFANREDEDIVAHDESSVASDASFDADDASFDADDASFDAEPLLGETWNPVARLESSEEDDESILESTE